MPTPTVAVGPGITLGAWRIRSLETGRFALDGGAMFGVVPRVLWERAIPADDKNRIEMAARVLLVEATDGTTKALIDTGMGHKWSPRHAAMYGMDPDGLAVEEAVRQAGLDPDDITDVLLTHLHFDHAGGATRERDGELRPTFERARYWIQRRNLEWARNPTPKDRASYRPEDFEPLADAGVLEILDGPGSWRDGIDLSISDGHTTGMQLPRIHGPEGSLLYGADLFPTAAHVPVPWVMAYDNQPLVTMEEKAEILSRAADEGWIFAFEHDPTVSGRKVVRNLKGFAAGDAVAF